MLDPQVLGATLLAAIGVLGLLSMLLGGLLLLVVSWASGVREEFRRITGDEYPNEYMRRKAALRQ